MGAILCPAVQQCWAADIWRGTQVMLLMDLHAHMSSYEVIGLLGGTWDMERLAIRIVAAFPCRRAQGSHSSTGVELDPEDEVATRALMDRDGLKPIGWCAPLDPCPSPVYLQASLTHAAVQLQQARFRLLLSRHCRMFEPGWWQSSAVPCSCQPCSEEGFLSMRQYASS